MSDPLDDLKAALKASPAPAKRDLHLRAAEKEFSTLHQGLAAEARPTPERARGRFFSGVENMLTRLTTRAGLALTSGLVATGLAVFIFLPQDMTGPGPDARLTQTEAPVIEPIAVPGATGSSTVTATDSEDPEPVEMEQASPEVAADTSGARAPDAAADGDTLGRLGLDMQTARPQSREAEAGLAARPKTTKRKVLPAPSRTREAASGPMYSLPVPPKPADEPRIQTEPNSEVFAEAENNPVKVVTEDPVSTFSIDVDTASYSVIRSSLNAGQLPPKGAVRAEEVINYFSYQYANPEGDAPFSTQATVTATPWNPDTQLVHIALQGEMPQIEDRPPLNLVFLIDSSGSMGSANKLPLLKQSLRLMLPELRPEDQVAIVAYAGSSGLVLEPTSAAERSKILQALDQIGAGGSTAGQAGLQQAYSVAESMAEDGEVSRVILATDGDFNVGLRDPDALKEFIAEKRDTGTYLSVLGFGRGNLDDATMQALAQNGNGQAAYIDTLSEARKVLVDQLTGALFPIANDVKIQVEFNPAAVAEYRLIGYETRALRREDFNNDKVDAGEIGAGHRVTAIYEVTPVGSPALRNDPLRYGGVEPVAGDASELGFLRLRYKAPGEDSSQLIETPIVNLTSTADGEVKFAIAMAGFAQLLENSDYLNDWSYEQAIALATEGRGQDTFGYRAEAIQLMRLAESLSAQ